MTLLFYIAYRKERNPETRRVPMQHLQMSTENQQMVRDMLSSLHLGDVKLNPIIRYKAKE